MKQEGRNRRNRFKPKRIVIAAKMRLIASSTLLSIGISMLPIRVFAAGSLLTSSADVRVGALPLLAALAIGIAVAVGAVIAFLQMTARGKEKGDLSSGAIHDEESFEDIEHWNDENDETSSIPEYEDNPLTDYTIPVTQLLAYPDRVEAAGEGEPRVCGVEGEHAGSCYGILNRRLSFGRDPVQCSILFPYEAAEISRLHCTLRFVEESRIFVLEDHGSSNGTFFSNGERLLPGKWYELYSGQRFSLSGSEHLFEVRVE